VKQLNRMLACVVAVVGTAAFTSCAADATRSNACPPAVTLLDPKGWEPGAATYRARQDGDAVTITATGENRTAGYRMQLAQQPMKIFPPKFVLYRQPPEGIAAQVITPFTVCVSFKANSRVDFISVRDNRGEQRVRVERRE